MYAVTTKLTCPAAFGAIELAEKSHAANSGAASGSACSVASSLSTGTVRRVGLIG
jgi:hypothetical protein